MQLILRFILITHIYTIENIFCGNPKQFGKRILNAEYLNAEWHFNFISYELIAIRSIRRRTLLISSDRVHVSQTLDEIFAKRNL